jgi:uncharacterized protein YgiM (DUF1202 family)
MLTAADYYDTAMALLAEGIDELDTDKITRAIGEMESGNDAINRAHALLLALQQGGSASTPPAITEQPTANSNANLRSGPSTDYPVVGRAAQGQRLDVVGRNEAGDWYLLDSGAWIAAFLVNNAPTTLPEVEP